jgi:hypothetical protein
MAETPNKEVKLKLDQLLRIKEDLEDSIRKDEGLMRRQNSRPSDEEVQIDFEETKRLYELKLKQLVDIKLVISNANMPVNNLNIYLLSNLNRQRVFLESLNTFEGERTTLKSAGKNIKYTAKLSRKKVEEELKVIETQIRSFETKLSDFNHDTEVTVSLQTELNLV